VIFLLWDMIDNLSQRKGHWFSNVMPILFGSFSLLACWFGVGNAAKGSAKFLNRIDDPRIVPTILELVAIGHWDNSTRDSLVKLLPQLTDDDLWQLTAGQRNGLLRLLEKRSSVELRLATLSGLSTIGQPGDIPKIESSCIAGSPSKLIADSAAECIQRIRERDEVLDARAGLLTPATQPDSSGCLLRAAGSTSADESALLRPVEPKAELTGNQSERA
jgi:hypothetical protein